jgi:hypothetical protein
MNSKLLIIGILIITITLFGLYIVHVHKSTVPSEEQLKDKFSELKAQYQEKKSQGYDLKEVERLVIEAKHAYDEGDYNKANKFLDEAFNALKNAEIITTETKDYLVQAKKDCAIQVQIEATILLETNYFRFLAVKMTEKEAHELKKDKCVLTVLTTKEARERYESLPEETKEAVREKIKEFRLQRTKEDVPEVPKELISEYQLYVTPDDPAVQALSKKVYGPLDAYSTAVNWIWVSDQTLNQVAEKWLKPHEFLLDTPNYDSNPVKGRIVSDCSEQANTLASLLRAEGIASENVRVVLGKVDFDGEIGGHAWVEVYEEGVWIPLEATSGPYWDDDKKQLVESDGLPYTYFKFFPYPVLERWVYYSDHYFFDVRTKKGNPPTSWKR